MRSDQRLIDWSIERLTDWFEIDCIDMSNYFYFFLNDDTSDWETTPFVFFFFNVTYLHYFSANLADEVLRLLWVYE